jgi:hypothetical protein
MNNPQEIVGSALPRPRPRIAGGLPSSMLNDAPAEVVRRHREATMAKSGKERIIPPSKKTDIQASKELRRGSGPGGRVMSDASVAKKQGVKRPKGR